MTLKTLGQLLALVVAFSLGGLYVHWRHTARTPSPVRGPSMPAMFGTKSAEVAPVRSIDPSKVHDIGSKSAPVFRGSPPAPTAETPQPERARQVLPDVPFDDLFEAPPADDPFAPAPAVPQPPVLP